ncbi:MAG TPA: alpha/beta hydrolase-fold protein [Pyrinomonadaceae bacterium]|jgi:predicted alpha/beta superfamily hydrolase|nr:alpha/beta hydrolase-fold protein [Pyrinomonadaceae bacterium]
MKPATGVIMLFGIVLTVGLCFGTTPAQRAHTLTGDVRIHKSFHSNVLANDRDIIVYLPPGYESSKHKRYAVFYMHDGQNLFDGATSFIPGQEWRVDETAQRLITSGKIEPLIVVGVYNTKDRIDEYTPAADAKYKQGGKADLYGRMLVSELKPFIDSQYRTKRDAKHTGLGGSSLGGLASLYLALEYPRIFGRAAIVSPSVWFADKQIVHYVESLAKKPDLRIWIDIGAKEGRTEAEAQQSVDDTRLLRDALVKKGWKLGKDLKYFEAEGAEHNEAAWAARVESILTFLFP